MLTSSPLFDIITADIAHRYKKFLLQVLYLSSRDTGRVIRFEVPGPCNNVTQFMGLLGCVKTNLDSAICQSFARDEQSTDACIEHVKWVELRNPWSTATKVTQFMGLFVIVKVKTRTWMRNLPQVRSR